jgi:hypothetical protein
MSKKSAIPNSGNDCIMTPPSLALAIVGHFKPHGYSILEPCEGEGAFTAAFETWGTKLVFSCELARGEDFLTWEAPVDWIITNPPWSKIGSKRATKKKPRQIGFLEKSMQVAHDIVFLCNANVFFVKARINLMKKAGFHFREFAYVENPKKPWPQMGLQLAAVHISRTPGNCQFTSIDWKP